MQQRSDLEAVVEQIEHASHERYAREAASCVSSARSTVLADAGSEQARRVLSLAESNEAAVAKS